MSLVAQCLWYGAQLPPSMRCFAVSYSTFQLNVRPSDAHQGKTPQELFHKQVPNLSKALIFGSPLHVKIRRSTQHRPDQHTLLRTFVGFQGTSHIYQYIGDTGGVQYATHAVVHKLCLHWLYADRSPAARILFGTESHPTLVLHQDIVSVLLKKFWNWNQASLLG